MKYKNEILSDLEHLKKFADVLSKGILLGDEKAYKIACEIVAETQKVRMKYVIGEKVEKFQETGILETF